MLKLIQVEFLKLRRRKFIWLMLLAALFMPLAAVFYFSSVKGTGVDPIMFYKWTAFSYTPWIILLHSTVPLSFEICLDYSMQ